MKSHFHLYYVSYANGKYVSHGLRPETLQPARHLFVNLALALQAESLKDVFRNTKRQSEGKIFKVLSDYFSNDVTYEN